MVGGGAAECGCCCERCQRDLDDMKTENNMSIGASAGLLATRRIKERSDGTSGCKDMTILPFIMVGQTVTASRNHQGLRDFMSQKIWVLVQAHDCWLHVG
jgi:hypothetical protein